MSAKDKRSRNGATNIALQLVGIFVFGSLWALGASVASSPSVLPGPIATVEAAAKLLRNGYGSDLLATALRSVSSWILSLLVGIPLGILLGLHRGLHGMVSGVTDFLRNLPAFMFVGVLVALGTTGEIARLSIISFTSVLIVIHQCSQSVRRMPQTQIDLVRAYRGSTWFILSRVVFFEALAWGVLPVARTAVGICFIVSIVVEMLLIPEHGIGGRILVSMSSMELPVVYGFILLVGCIGWSINKAVEFIAQRLVFWV